MLALLDATIFLPICLKVVLSFLVILHNIYDTQIKGLSNIGISCSCLKHDKTSKPIVKAILKKEWPNGISNMEMEMSSAEHNM